MESVSQVKKAFNDAAQFLNPILSRAEARKIHGQSILEILGKNSCIEISGCAERSVVITRALNLLSRIHVAFAVTTGDSVYTQGKAYGEDDASEDNSRRRILHALLDLISLEGIYPSLSPGVGIPLQQRVISVLPAGVIAKQTALPLDDRPSNRLLLDQILAVLSDILFDNRPSIQPVIRSRILSDLISAASDLAFNSEGLPSCRVREHEMILSKIIEETPSPTLLLTLSGFLQSKPVPWFREVVSSQLAQIPLRDGGVLQTILFVVSRFAPSLGQEAQTSTNGPHFTVHAIMQISKLLSSVPKDMDPVIYFSKIGLQLLVLIDGSDPDLRKTAAYTVSNGILGKRTFGTPGAIGHSIFVEPIFKALTAELDESAIHWIAPFANRGREYSIEILVDGSTVSLVINRLRALTLQYPDPGLVKRLVHPILLPLWGLACYSFEHQVHSLHDKVITLLEGYFGLSVGLQPLKMLVDNLLWNGGPSWEYCLDKEGRVSLKKRDTSRIDQFNLIQLIDSLQSRVELLTNLLSQDPDNTERTADLFLYVSEAWLVGASGPCRALDEMTITEDSHGLDRTIQKLINAKIAGKLMESYKDTLSRRPLKIFELISQVIRGEIERLNAIRRPTGASLPGLADIVHLNGDEHEGPSAESPEDSLSAIFSLLSTILTAPEFSVFEQLISILGNIKSQLDQLIPNLTSALQKAGTTATMLLEIHLASPRASPSQLATEKLPSHVSDFDIHRQALTNLGSDLPPIQAEGFSLLSGLIKKFSPVLDIPSTLTLLLSIITDATGAASSEEYTYLNAIKQIGILASRHPRTVIKVLVERYADTGEELTLDQRLKTGEALLRAVQGLGEALAGEAGQILGDGMITVAGRRGHKPEAQARRKQHLAKSKREEVHRNKQELTMLSQFPTVGLVDDEDSDTESAEQVTYASKIIAAWAAGAPSDTSEPDDLRVRTSALSILASAIQTNIAGIGHSIVSSAVDLALTILTLEPQLESAILRRASVVLLLDILKATDRVRENRGHTALGFGFSLSDISACDLSYSAADYGSKTIGNIPHMLRTLQFVESHESDAIVRGHIRTLVESLEAWMEKSLMYGISRDKDEQHLELGSRISGLSISPLSGVDRHQGPRIEEIE